MVRECIVIIVILLIAGYSFLPSGRRLWFGSNFPLLPLPALNIIFSPHFLSRFAYGETIRLLMYAVCFVVTTVWVLLFSRRLPKSRSKVLYIVSAIGFTAVLVGVLIFKGPYIE